MMTFPTEWKNKNMFQTTNQKNNDHFPYSWQFWGRSLASEKRHFEVKQNTSHHSGMTTQHDCKSAASTGYPLVNQHSYGTWTIYR
jgi:hypothetical protein